MIFRNYNTMFNNIEDLLININIYLKTQLADYVEII